jgi:nucleoside-diphosphate-sugar epimerase
VALRTGLIGYTGFVGGSLREAMTFDVEVNRKNSNALLEGTFDLVVCAGAPAAKWIANSEPEEDLANIRTLIDLLSRSSIGRLVLVSTVDVYPDPRGVDEASPIDNDANDAYGGHRRALEVFVDGHFDDCLIVRLPALFGPGLKKNFVYDLLHRRKERFTDARSEFQFYDVRRLSDDMERFSEAGLRLVNVTSEPVSAADIASEGFGVEYDHSAPSGPVFYDVRTRHGEALGGTKDGYLYTQEETLAGLRQFVADWQDA